MNLYKPLDIVKCLELGGEPYTKVHWGYVGKDDKVLLMEWKPGGPMRYGHLVLPGGSMRSDESALQTAERKVREETGVMTRHGNLDRFVRLHESAILKSWEECIGIYEPEDGSFWYYDKGSGTRCTGQMIDLVPRNNPRQPDEEVGADPRYVRLEDALGSLQSELTPATKMLLEIAGHHHRRNIVGEKDILMLPCDMSSFLGKPIFEQDPHPVTV